MRSLADTFDILKQAWRKLPVRVALFAGLAVLAVGLVEIAGRYVPDDLAGWIDVGSVDRLLNHIISAMLVVTTFSLTVMVSVQQNSASQWTPRVHQLLMEDSTTQNTLATFIGAYVYALTAIALREIGWIASDGATISFFVTLLVLIMVIGSLIRWIFHLQTLGSLINISRRIEDRVQEHFHARYAAPCLGGHALTDETEIPTGSIAVGAPQSGYVTRIWADGLQEQAIARGIRIYLVAPIGSFVARGEPLALVAMETAPQGAVDTPLDQMICEHIPLSDVRTFGQDPRLGLIVLAEVASKALSPGINDAGTAIDVLHRLTRLLVGYEDESPPDRPTHDRLHVPPLTPDDLIEDAFDAIARDGAGVIEVQVRLQKGLAQLIRHNSPAMVRAARVFARQAARDAEQALSRPGDIRRLRAARAVGPKI